MSLANAARSGTPVVAPALSLQSDIAETSGLNSALSPTIAKALAQALMRPFLDSSAFSFESQTLTVT